MMQQPLGFSSSVSIPSFGKLPADVISLILTFLPIKEAVKTSILSKQWRHLWRSIPQLVFDGNFATIEAPRSNSASKINSVNKAMLKVYQALLLHDGPLNKFELSIPEMYRCPQLYQLLLYLSTISVKELCLRFVQYTSLPSSLFSVPNLNSLKLHGFIFKEPTWSVGFSKLTLLELKDVFLHTGFFNDFLPKCPILEELRVLDCNVDKDPVFVTSSVKVLLFHSCLWTIRFVNTSHLSVLSVVESSREYFHDDRDYRYYDFHPTCKSDIVSQFGSLRALKQLNLGVQFLTSLSEADVPYHLPASLHNLKVLEIPRILLGRLNEARVLACLIMSSPNLLKLTIRHDNEYNGRYRSSNDPGGLQTLLEPEEHIRVCCLQRLEEFTIGNSRGTQVELDLVRFVLATAPVLKRVFINPKKGLSSEIVTKFLVEVTQYERISRYAKVNYALVKLDEA
ncbi:F-box/FBD/LRR-repeat protein At1g13570 [Linum perenne]